MTRHIVRLVWNRKRRNALLMVEIMCAFLVLVAVVVVAVHTFGNTRSPVGFDRQDVWHLAVNRPAAPDDRDGQAVADHPQMLALLAELRGMSQVQAVGGAFTGPFNTWDWSGSLRLQDGRRVQTSYNRVTDGYLDVLRLRVVEGRWFTREDDVSAWDAVVVNRRLALELFGGAPATGRTIEEAVDARRLADGQAPPLPKRIVGVVEEFRQAGELSTPGNYLFYRMHIDRPAPAAGTSTRGRADQMPDQIYLRMAPGTTAGAEEMLLRRVAAVAPTWTFKLQTLDAERAAMNRQFILPLAGLGVVAVSLLIMVALGLTGVLWQNVTQRTREFGLRRAAGATAADVERQVLLELLALGTLAILVGCAIVVQFAVLPRPAGFPEIGRSTLLVGVGLSVATIYAVMCLCGWYPSRLATRVPPAEALHYE